jgi:hypothetical protein
MAITTQCRPEVDLYEPTVRATLDRLPTPAESCTSAFLQRPVATFGAMAMSRPVVSHGSPEPRLSSSLLDSSTNRHRWLHAGPEAIVQRRVGRFRTNTSASTVHCGEQESHPSAGRP